MLSETPWRLVWFSIALLAPVALVAVAVVVGVVRELAVRATRRERLRNGPLGEEA